MAKYCIKHLQRFEQGLYFKEIGFSKSQFTKRKILHLCVVMHILIVMNLCSYYQRSTPKTFNPLTQKTVRCGVEMVVSNKGPDAINRKVPVELKNEKTRANSGNML